MSGYSYDVMHISQYSCDKCKQLNIPKERTFSSIKISKKEYSPEMKKQAYKVFGMESINDTKTNKAKVLAQERIRIAEFENIPHTCYLRLDPAEAQRYDDYKKS